MEYLPTWTIKINQEYGNIPYMDDLGIGFWFFEGFELPRCCFYFLLYVGECVCFFSPSTGSIKIEALDMYRYTFNPGVCSK